VIYWHNNRSVTVRKKINMDTARHLTPEEQYLAGQFAAQAEQNMSRPQAYHTHQQAGTVAPISQSSSNQHHHMTRASQMMAAVAAASAPRQGLDNTPGAARMAANNAVNFEIGKALAAAGRSNLLPFLAPRPNTATSASSVGPQRDGAVDNPHQPPEAQRQRVGNDLQEGGLPIIPRAPKAGDPIDTVQKRDKSLEGHKLLEIPPVGTPMPSMEDMQLTDVAYKFIHPHDVLCGRGGGTNNHPGNEAFRDLVTAQKVVYLNASKRDKPFVSRGIVRAIRSQSPPGRFLQKNEQTGLWFDIGDQKAREKTSQALREGAPEIRREIETIGTTPPRTIVPPVAFPFAGQRSKWITS
jgi:hypothetical protein